MIQSHRSNFIERSITGAVSFVKESVFSDEYASKKGLLQSIDPRVKLASFALFILAVLFTKTIAVVLYLYAVSLVLTYLSDVDMRFFLKRTWIFIPLFSIFIAIPALFSIFTPGEALTSFEVLGLRFIITRQGFRIYT